MDCVKPVKINNSPNVNTLRRLPAEWENQEFVQLTWPNVLSNWRDQDGIQNYFCKLASSILRFENLLITCFDQEHLQKVQAQLELAGPHKFKYNLFVVPSNDVWTRDTGPITVFSNGKHLVLNFIFNAWGNKTSYDLDSQIVKKIYTQKGYVDADYQAIDMVLEGGSIDTDGAGTLLTTTNCLLNKNRNPDLSKNQIETNLTQYLGIQHFLWLNHGELQGDDTDSHVDILARFVDPDTIVYMQCSDPKDSHYEELAKMEAELQAFRKMDGQPYKLVPLPWPKPIYCPYDPTRRLSASYANFLIINNAILLPVYADEADLEAQKIFAKLFPGREIVGIDSRIVIQNCGSLHCLTMQYPA